MANILVRLQNLFVSSPSRKDGNETADKVKGLGHGSLLAQERNQFRVPEGRRNVLVE